METVTIRALDPAEWESFKEVRLFALMTAPGVFASAYAEEVNKTAEEWRETISGPGHQVFGLFDLGRIIGITAAFTWREDPSGSTALMAMSFIQPEYRGRGLSQQLYEARLAWIRARPQFKCVIVTHRESNDASRLANQRFGFREVGRELRTWPDGTEEDEIRYELRIGESGVAQTA